MQRINSESTVSTWTVLADPATTITQAIGGSSLSHVIVLDLWSTRRHPATALYWKQCLIMQHSCGGSATYVSALITVLLTMPMTVFLPLDARYRLSVRRFAYKLSFFSTAVRTLRSTASDGEP